MLVVCGQRCLTKNLLFGWFYNHQNSSRSRCGWLPRSSSLCVSRWSGLMGGFIFIAGICILWSPRRLARPVFSLSAATVFFWGLPLPLIELQQQHKVKVFPTEQYLRVKALYDSHCHTFSTEPLIYEPRSALNGLLHRCCHFAKWALLACEVEGHKSCWHSRLCP